jgi:anti-sigma regulatory factor (Ser/Thr protein kinase)
MTILPLKAGDFSKQFHKAVRYREAIANAVLHGNQFDARKRIFLSAELLPTSLVFSVRDEGDGCDLDSVPDHRHNS